MRDQFAVQAEVIKEMISASKPANVSNKVIVQNEVEVKLTTYEVLIRLGASQLLIENFPADVLSSFEKSKSLVVKQEGLRRLSKIISESKMSNDVLESLIKFFKVKLGKDYKVTESIDLTKEYIGLFSTIAKTHINEKLDDRVIRCMMPMLSEKLGDQRYFSAISDLVYDLTFASTPNSVAKELTQNASFAHHSDIIISTCLILEKLVLKFKIKDLPLKDMLDFAIIGLERAQNH